MEGVLKPLRTLEDLNEAIDGARFDINHSLAKMVPNKSKVRKTKNIAFLSAFPRVKLKSASHVDVQRTMIQTTKHKPRSKPSKERAVQIFVRNPVKETISLRLIASTSISKLKGILQDNLGISSAKQHLYTMKGLQLCDALSLEDHGVVCDATLELRLVPGLMGGGRKRKSTGDTSVQTPREEEPKTRGASAKNATQSNPSDAAVATGSQQPISINFDKCPFHIGPSSGNTYNYDMPITSDVLKDGRTDTELTDRLLSKMQHQFKECKLIIDLLKFFRQRVSAELANIMPGSVKFIVNVTSHEDLDRLWVMYQSGELANKLAKILITDELTAEDKSSITLRVTMLESDYREGCKCLGLVHQKLPQRMSDWTMHHVKSWLLQNDVPETVAKQLFDEEVDGKTLEIYTMQQMLEDFEIKKGKLRFILSRRDKMLEMERQYSESISPKHPARDKIKINAKGEEVTFSMPNVPIRGADMPAKSEQVDSGHRLIDPFNMETTKQQLTPVPSDINPSPVCQPTSASKEKLGSKDENVASTSFQHETPFDANHTTVQPKPEKHNKSTQPKEVAILLSSFKSKKVISQVKPRQKTSGEQTPLESQPSTDTIKISATGHDIKSTLEKEDPPVSRVDLSHPRSFILEEVRPTSAAIQRVEPSKTTSELEVGNPPSTELRIRQLLTGDEHGEMNESFYPVLVVNKPQEYGLPSEMPSEADLQQGSIAQQFGFIKAIKWVTVLDFNSKSLVNGLCKLYHDERMVTLQQPELFKSIESDVELRSSIDFPEKTLWVFTNGREDDPSFETPRMNLQDWNRQRSRDVEASISFFSKPSVIPEGRAVIVILILSDDDIDILCDTFRKISSSFQGLQNITCMVEDRETYIKFVSGVSKWFSEDEINQRSVVGLTWRDINRIMMQMKGIHQTMNHELPFGLRGQPCFLSDKQREEWNDLTVICKNECENTDMNESNPGYEKFAQEKELSFYHGAKVDWWNFAIGDKEIQCRKGCGHVLKRNGFGEVLQKVIRPLNSRKFDDSKIVTVTLLHEPGAGGSTLARHVFWELHREHRCIVINRVTNNTVNQILEVRRHGYENQDVKVIPPVCVLVENLDDVELVDLIADMEEVSKCVDFVDGAVCVLLHCKGIQMNRTFQHKSDRKFLLYHKLESREKTWFERKFTELEDKEKKLQTGEFKPDNLLAFMVMKEEFNPAYIQNVVSRILHDIKEKELLLIKFCAFLNSYRPGSSIPISCCDKFMMSSNVVTKRSINQRASSPWEKLVSPSFDIIVKREDREMTILHRSIAHEALMQTQAAAGQSLFDVATDFLNSELLSSPSYSRHTLEKTTHDLLIKRTKLESSPSESKSQTDFSDLIEDLKFDGPNKAVEILKLGFKKLKDAFVAQQLARLYLKEGKFGDAMKAAEDAIEMEDKNAYFLDTKGRIIKDEISTLSDRCEDEQQVMDGDVCAVFISKSFEAMEVFHKSYEVSKEMMQTEYTGLYAEVDVAFRLLKVLYTCVEPLRTHGHPSHVREQPFPKLSQDLQSTLSDTKIRLEATLEVIDDVTTYYKDGSHAQMAKKTLDEMKGKLRKYSILFEKYYGKQSFLSKGGYSTITSVEEQRRVEVKQLQCGSFRDIFELDGNKETSLQESLHILEKNSKKYNFFDLKTKILIHLALSSINKQIMSADDVYQKFVRPLFKEMDSGDSFYPPFFMMMFLWPIEGVVSERKDRNDLTYYFDELKNRGERAQRSSHPDRVKRHAKYNMKPRTYFFLGQGEDLRAFAHIHEIHGSQGKVDRPDGDDEFWQSDIVKKRLVRLEGFLQNPTSLMYRSHKGTRINIKLAVPYNRRTPSQEKVAFYLGFNWEGPVAYGVKTMDKTRSKTDTMRSRFHEAYPEEMAQDQSKMASKVFYIQKLKKKCVILERNLHQQEELMRQGRLTDKKESKLKKNVQEIKQELADKERRLNRLLKELEESLE